jgi:toxin ParE1/3/4
MVGRTRPELRAEYRSVTFGNYVIFLRYLGDGVNSHDLLQILHVLYGARDLDAYFQSSPNAVE